MIQKISARIYLMMSALVLFLIIPVMGYSLNYPQWLQSYQDGIFESKGFYYGVGSAEFIGDSPDHESRRRSKDRALDELCYQLSVSIKSEFKEELAQKGQQADQNVTSSLFVSTRKVLSGILEKYNWADNQKNVYWVMVVIDRAKADRQVEQQDFVKEVVDRLENNQEEIKAGLKKIGNILIQQGKVQEARLKKLEKLLKTIDQKVGSSGDKTKKEYTGIKKEITTLGDKWNKQEEMLLDQNKKMETLMAQNKALQDLITKISNNIQGDVFLALSHDDVRNQSNNPEFNISITPLKGQGADYYDGENIRFRVKASRNCYIKVIYLSSIGDGATGETKMNTLLFPNAHDRENFIMAGKPTIIGRKDELIVQKPYGKDIVTVVASLRQFTDIEESIRQAAKKSSQYYQTVTRSINEAVRYRSIGTDRGIRVKLPPRGDGDEISFAHESFVSDTCFIITRKM
jgi:Domain of unknown function (DUF4384)